MHGTELGGYAYGMWPVVAFNIILFLFFAIGFIRPKKKFEWASMGAFIGFIVALFTEMYGFPLTILSSFNVDGDSVSRSRSLLSPQRASGPGIPGAGSFRYSHGHSPSHKQSHHILRFLHHVQGMDAHPRGQGGAAGHGRSVLPCAASAI